LYFDNFPHGHYGTIRQQIWSVLHFPFQLAIVGVVEGSQQLALARYTIKNMYKVGKDLTQYCNIDHMDGSKLRDKLLYVLNYFELDSKIETLSFYKEANNLIFNIGNITDICKNTSDDDWPDQLYNLSSAISNGMYVGLGMKIPAKKLEEGYEPLDIAIDSWELVYMYYWGCFCVLIICLIAFLFLIRRHKADLFDFTSIISRFIVLGVGGALLGLYADKERLFAVLETPMLLPICVILLFLILLTDKLSSIWCNWRLQKSGQPYALEVEEHDHHHSHAAVHGEVHERAPLQRHGLGHGHHDSVQSDLEDARKSAHYSMYSDTTPLTASNTEYNAHGGGYAMEPLMSPPLMSPPLMSPPLMSPPLMSPPLMSPDPTTPGLGAKSTGARGYMPVSNGQDYGA
jgi:hypothetical protein